VDLRGELSRATGMTVHIERDAIACALAKMWLGPADGCAQDSFVYLTVSDGVGAGLVVNGEVFRGHRDAAGEFGHIPLALEGPFCLCGSRGCLEAHTSTSRRWRATWAATSTTATATPRSAPRASR
jgi:predicted NBD/HSP70 family sugar kinase